ncbi:MAG: hypothetical protein ABSE52_09235 [Candidatus Dormibacteria bacterium]
MTIDNRRVSTPRAPLAALTLLSRTMVIGATFAGVAGAIAGLVLGLRAYAPTAWFAVVELGLPATLVGALAGLAAGSVLLACGRIARWRRP